MALIGRLKQLAGNPQLQGVVSSSISLVSSQSSQAFYQEGGPPEPAIVLGFREHVQSTIANPDSLSLTNVLLQEGRGGGQRRSVVGNKEQKRKPRVGV